MFLLFFVNESEDGYNNYVQLVDTSWLDNEEEVANYRADIESVDSYDDSYEPTFTEMMGTNTCSFFFHISLEILHTNEI